VLALPHWRRHLIDILDAAEEAMAVDPTQWVKAQPDARLETLWHGAIARQRRYMAQAMEAADSPTGEVRSPVPGPA
jgi:hypothetical protein